MDKLSVITQLSIPFGAFVIIHAIREVVFDLHAELLTNITNVGVARCHHVFGVFYFFFHRCIYMTQEKIKTIENM